MTEPSFPENESGVSPASLSAGIYTENHPSGSIYSFSPLRMPRGEKLSGMGVGAIVAIGAGPGVKVAITGDPEMGDGERWDRSICVGASAAAGAVVRKSAGSAIDARRHALNAIAIMIPLMNCTVRLFTLISRRSLSIDSRWITANELARAEPPYHYHNSLSRLALCPRRRVIRFIFFADSRLQYP
jgi:anaerobic selenocysteine-containing dehydrogenase